MIRERIPITGSDPGPDARALVPVDVRTHEASDRFVASAVAQGRVVARLRQNEGGEYATEAVVVDQGVGAVIVFLCRASAAMSPYRAKSVDAGLRAARGVLSTHGSFNW